MGAAQMQVHERNSLEPAIQRQFDMEMQEKLITEQLQNFVMGAMEGGALSATEAESILHPLQHHLKHCLNRLHELDEGIVVEQSTHEGEEGVVVFAGRHMTHDEELV